MRTALPPLFALAAPLLTLVPSCGGPERELAAGAACHYSSECLTGLCLAEHRGYPDGVCTAPCDEACDDPSLVCVPIGDTALCMRACETDAGCRDGWICAADAGACLPDCRDGWDCGAFTCDAATGACTLPAHAGAADGAACAADRDCASGLCVGEPAAGALCASPCADGACPDGATCGRLGDYLLCLPACDAAHPCAPDRVCAEALGACLPDCRSGFDCGDTLSCQPDGRCDLSPSPGGPVGAPCAARSDCASGLCFAERDAADLQTGWSDGMCAAPCGAAACGAGTGCVVLDGVSWCLPSCAAGGCRSGYACSSDLALCLPDCRLGWPCGDAFVCEAASGECVIDTSSTTDLAPLGAPCTSHAACASGACLLPPAAAVPWPHGVCTRPCAGGCPAGSACAPLGATALCVPSCLGGCPAGFVCGPQGAACLPSCAQGWPCPSGTFCNGQGFCSGGGRGGGG